jgi:FkbM family methyltransferase
VTVSLALIYLERTWFRFCPVKSCKDFGRSVLSTAVELGIIRRVWQEFRPGLWMRINPGNYVQQDLLLRGTWEPAGTLCLERRLGEGSVFIDVGANAGYFSLIASKLVGRQGRVFAFEPNPSVASELKANLLRSCVQNVSVEQAACSNSNSPVSLYISSNSNTGKTSLFSKNAKSKTRVTVPCTRLDDFVADRNLDRIDIVKIDVEGAELMVLEGMKNCLLRFRPQVILELEPILMPAAGTELREFVAFFDDCDYDLRLIDSPNYLAVPRENTKERST